MSANSLNKSKGLWQSLTQPLHWRMLIALPAWVFTSFILAQLVVLAGIWAAK
jgi:hypothetical protein